MRALIIGTFIAAMLAACGGSDKGDNAYTGNDRRYGGRACSGCSHSNLLYSAAGRSGGLTLAMDFHVGNSDQYHNDSVISNGYYTGGSVNGVGLLSSAGGTGFMANYCNIPSGNYAVEVTNFGTIDATGTIKNLRLRAHGHGYEFHFVQRAGDGFYFLTASPAIRSCDGYDYTTELFGQIVLERVRKNNYEYSCYELIGFTGSSNYGGPVCP